MTRFAVPVGKRTNQHKKEKGRSPEFSRVPFASRAFFLFMAASLGDTCASCQGTSQAFSEQYFCGPVPVLLFSLG